MPIFLLLLGLLIETPAVAAPDVFGDFADLRSLARAKSGVATFMQSSRDPNITNADAGHYLGTRQDDGQTWVVLTQETGPGAILRIWMTGFDNFMSLPVRVYIDNPNQPVINCTIRNLFGLCPPFDYPMAGTSSGGFYHYFPLVFTNYCRIQALHPGPHGFYWQVSYQKYDSAAGLNAYTNPLHPSDQSKYLAAKAQSNALGTDPKTPSPNAVTTTGTVSVAPGQTVTLWQTQGAGMIDQLWIDPTPSLPDIVQNARLVCSWDDEADPSIDAPLGDFFGTSYFELEFRSLVVGMTPQQGYYCFLPMPYGRGAKIQLRNQSNNTISSLAFRIVSAPAAQDDPNLLRLHTFSKLEYPTAYRERYLVCDIKGAGHFVGLVAGMEGASEGGPYGYLEGDEYIYIDGNRQAAIEGTGTEDYFNCGFYYIDGPSIRPFHGCTLKEPHAQRVSTYRFHISDYIPFSSRLKFEFEVGGEFETNMASNYRTTAFYYRKHNYQAPPPDWVGGARVQNWPGVVLTCALAKQAEFDRYRVYRSTSPDTLGTLLINAHPEPLLIDSAPPAVPLVYYTIQQLSPEGFVSTNRSLSVAPGAALRNALNNGGFEENTGGLAAHWSSWPNAGGYSGDNSVRHGGAFSQKLADWSSNYKALYQRAAVTQGMDIVGGIWVSYSRPFIGNTVDVGIDPFGGTDPMSPNVIYVRTDAKRAWQLAQLRVRAMSSHVTLFARVKNVNVQSEWYFDDAYLIELSDPALAAPTGLTVAPAGKGCLRLHWTNPGAAQFAVARLYRSTTPGALGVLVRDGLTAGAYDDCGLDGGATYYYTVRAYYLTGRESANTTQVSGTAPSHTGAGAVEVH